MNYRRLLSIRASRGTQPAERAGGDFDHLLLATARPAVQFFWTVLVVATLVFTLARNGPDYPWALAVMLSSYVVVLTGNHCFPYKKYRPAAFFFLMCACVALISSIVYLTGNRESLTGFLFFMVPIFAASYLGYAGTLLVAAITALARYIPFINADVSGTTQFSLALNMVAFLAIGVLASYIFQGEKMYARESQEYRHLLKLAHDKERDISLIYNLSRRFSYTLDSDTVLKTTVTLTRKMLSSPGALVFLLEDGRPVLKAALGILPFSDMSVIHLPAEEQWVERLTDGNDVVTEKVSLDWLPLPPPLERFNNISAVPMFVGGDTVGYLMCFSPARGFTEAHIGILSTIATQAAIAVEKSRLYTRTLDDKTKVETILSSLREGLLITDAEGILAQVNPVAERMLSISSTAIGRKLLDVLSPVLTASDLGEYSPKKAMDAVLDGHTIVGELTFSVESRVDAQAQFIPLKDQLGKVSGVVLFLHDITELRRIDEMKSNFVTNVSHELRTPLTSISGFVGLMLAGRAGSLTPQQARYLEVVSEESANLTKMIEDLLDLSRIQAGSARIETRRTYISDVLRTAVEELSTVASAKDIEIRTRISDGLPPVQVDPDRISQVFANIIGNAVKFTEPQGLVEITANPNGPYLQVQVSDTGAGIPAHALPHIFDRFFQAHPGEVGEDSGFGLGLAISQEIIEMHGGKIWVESDPGRGTSFYFTLPVCREVEDKC